MREINASGIAGAGMVINDVHRKRVKII
jgi:hypothetical protein